VSPERSVHLDLSADDHHRKNQQDLGADSRDRRRTTRIGRYRAGRGFSELNHLYRDWCGGRDNKYGNLVKERTVSLLLLSTSSYFGGDLARHSKELFFSRHFI